MKHLLLALTLALSLPSYAQLNVNRKIGQRWDKFVGGNWQGQDSLVFWYDTYGNETFRFAVEGQSGSWINNHRTTTNYDANQNISSETYENWSSNGWDKINKYSYSYNGANQKTETLYQTWNTTSNAWRNSGKIVNTYNGSQLRTKLESFTWDGNAWQPGTRQLFSYNGMNEIASQEYYVFTNSVFEKQERKDYLYAFGFTSSVIISTPDANDVWDPKTRILNLVNGSAVPPYIATSRTQRRNQVISNWEDSLRTTFSHTNGLLVQSESERYYPNTTSWVNLNLNTYDYNLNNLLIEEKNLSYSPSTSNYENTTRKLLTYNGNNLNDQTTYYVSDGSNGWTESAKDQMSYDSNDSLIYRLNENYSNASFTPNEQYFYHYANVPVGLKNYNDLFTNAQLYPNPSSDFVRIQTTDKMNGAYVATIYNLEGKKVWSQFSNKAAQELKFDIAHLSLGNYVLQIAEVSTGKLQHFKFSKL